MAPIVASGSGIPPQVLDDPALRELLSHLNELPDEVKTLADLEELTVLLDPWKEEWLFEEQVDLHGWIHPLNVMDSALSWILKNYSKNMLLLPRFIQTTDNEHTVSDERVTSMDDVHQCPPEILRHCASILEFSACLLRNSVSKNLYASVPIVSDLLASVDDEICDHAVCVLSALSLPPAMHKQQRPDHQLHTTQLHQASSSPFAAASLSPGNIHRTDVHDRLMATARAWGTRAMGFGLCQAVMTDDSIHGQGTLPVEMGLVHCSYYGDSSENENEKDDATKLIEISLSLPEMLAEGQFDGGNVSSPESSTASLEGTGDSEHAASKKRRRVTQGGCNVNIMTNQKKQTKSTAELFFLAVEKVGGIGHIPSDRWFSLLADIRLARAFYSQETRCAAVNRRLLALIAILHSHPSQEAMSGYFQAQPELCVELVDLLRPVVSGANVSAASVVSENDWVTRSGMRQDAISNLVGNSTVLFDVRMLAIEALTALVLRRDGSTGALSGASRSSSVLTELGVGKGQYLGMLPTLIRYSLASLASTAAEAESSISTHPLESIEATGSAFDIGLSFVEATMAPSIPRHVQAERALRFIDNVLTLTLAVIGTPTGTSSLVDCGLIPGLLATVSMDPAAVLEGLLRQDRDSFCLVDIRRMQAWMRFITAQAVQILESAIVTHNNALTAFHDLQGVDVLTARLSKEMELTRSHSMPVGKVGPVDANGDVVMNDAARASGAVDGGIQTANSILSSQRVLLYSVLTCLTVVFHQESSSSGAPTGGTQLKKQELTDAVLEILNNVKAYGGHLAALVATLLQDVMNSDPHVVRYVHESGIGASFLRLLTGDNSAGQGRGASQEPVVPPVAELIMGIPNVISALALTEDGAKAVADNDPFPALLRLFYHPDYAMPRSRCLLNEMTSIIGTSLDEIMRHVECLKDSVLSAIVKAMEQVVELARELTTREESACEFGEPSVAQKSELENERSCLIQYVLNFGQLLEQILHNEDHCEPFVDAGGLDALLRLFPLCMPSSVQFLPYTSSLSSPSVSTLHHSTTEESLNVAMKCIDFRYNARKLLQKLQHTATLLLDQLNECHNQLVGNNGDVFSLDLLPHEPLYKLTGSGSRDRLLLVSKYLRSLVNVQWITALLASAINAACQRNTETGSLGERDWKNELATSGFEMLFARLAEVHRMSLFEVCRVRAEEGFERRERERLGTRSMGICYRLRIVCPEGAVVRDGIEIDSCANIGNMEMADIVDSYDRCINSSGILRYRTRRGWVSEMTRGHGREPIAEVIGIWENGGTPLIDVEDGNRKKRTEAGILDLRSVGVGVLARGQSGFAELYGALSKVANQSVRSLSLPSSFADGDAGSGVASLIRILARTMMDGLAHPGVSRTALSTLTGEYFEDLSVTSAGAAMYLACFLNILHVGLFDDRRERRMVNFPLVVTLVSSDGFVHAAANEVSSKNKMPDSRTYDSGLGLHDAIRFVVKFGFCNLDNHARITSDSQPENDENVIQRVDRSVAASFPPVLSLLRKLVSTQMSSSPAAAIMSRMTWNDISPLLSQDKLGIKWVGDPDPDSFFRPESFTAELLYSLSKVVSEIWNDKRLLSTPPFLVHPITTLVGELLVVLEDASKQVGSNQSRSVNRIRLSDLIRQRQDEEDTSEAAEDDEFEPSEEAVTRLMEMGFSRDHAIDALESVRSNHLELASDYALANPPDPAASERRRLEREVRAQRRVQRQNEIDTLEGSRPQNEESTDNENVLPVNEEAASETQGNLGSESSELRGDSGMDVDPPQEARNPFLKAELDAWIEAIPKVSCDLLDRIPVPPACRVEQLASGSGRGENDSDGNAEAEALTVILCSFMLDLCNKYVKQRSKIASQVFRRLKSALSQTDESSKTSWNVPCNAEAAVAALCHAAVLITRAFPKSRLLILKEGIVRPLVSCLQLFCNPNDSLSSPSFPMWIAPCLLLLDTMAQPLVAFSDDELVKSIAEDSPDDEFCQVRTEHKEQVAELFSKASQWLCALSPSVTLLQPNIVDTRSLEEKDDECGNDMDIDGEKVVSPFSAIPAYFHLLPLETASVCLSLCQSLLQTCRREPMGKVLPPGIAHSTLLLLLRLLRTPALASQCLQMGIAEDILALSKKSSFTGNTGLVTLIFRRLLEDPPTLQAAMETEIRGTVVKLHGKTNSASEGPKPSVPLSAFIEAITPLLCRDPASFLKAMSLSVHIESPQEGLTETKVTLLSPVERSRRVKRVSDETKASQSKSPEKSDVKRDYSPFHGSKSKGKAQNKGQRHGSFSKRGRKERTDTGKPHLAIETPASHIASLLIVSVLSAASLDQPGHEEASFLWTGDLLEILADLVLAVPTCASAVHNYRPHRIKDKSKRSPLVAQMNHALQGCPSPPKTFVTYLLHVLLPQDRWTIRNDYQLWIRRSDSQEKESSFIKLKKKNAFRAMKLSQCAARVLVALVVRPGEGRKRVLADLVFALSGGNLGHGAPSVPSSFERIGNCPEPLASELHALNVWGELCLGLVAPRGNGKNLEAFASLSVENIRHMLDFGIVHALLYAMNRVRLCHPMASSTYKALILPMEILTRAQVNTAVKVLVEKELESTGDAQKDGGSSSVENHDFAGSDPLRVALLDHHSEPLIHAEDSDTENGGSQNDLDEEMDDGAGSEGDDAPSSGESGDDASDDESDDDDMDDEEGSEMGDSDDVSSDEVEEGGWNVDNENVFDPGAPAEVQEFEAEEDGTDFIDDNDEEEGWTRIESSGFGGMFLNRRGGGLAIGGDPNNRPRGFTDAAEAMLGSFLRNGDISGTMLSEIEGTLGIRIMNGGRILRANLGSDENERGDSLRVRVLRSEGGRETDRSRRTDVTGTLPHINQRNQPDTGYSGFTRPRHGAEISSMEYLYGGPSVSGGSRNYDTISPFIEPDLEEYPTLSLLDLDLFPGGPASAASSRTLHSLHPLLCGVDLPPVNSLVSDLLPHGIRASRRGLMTTRQPGDWTNASLSSGGYLVSTSNGNIIRSNRTNAGSSFGVDVASRTIGTDMGPVGWTDDGLPVDATVEEFRSAFELALGNTARAHRASEMQGSGDSNPIADGSSRSTDAAEPHNADDLAVATDRESGVFRPSLSPEDATEGPGHHHASHSHEAGSEGEGLASSMVAELRLSTGHEDSDSILATSERSSGVTADAVAEADVSPTEQQSEVNRGDPSDQQASGVAVLESSDIVGEMDVERFEAAPGDTAVPTQNLASPAAQNENELVCPPDIELDVFNSLPREMQQECVDQYNATRDLAAQLNGSTLDPEVLAALPEDMRREVIENDRQERRMREHEQTPANPANAEEMDNASFIASLSPDLREEILLQADEALLNSLPPGLLAEAQILRERASARHGRSIEASAFGAAAENGDVPGAARQAGLDGSAPSARRKQRSGKLKVEIDRSEIIYVPDYLPSAIGVTDLKVLVRLIFMLFPVRPTAYLQKVFYNLCVNPVLRSVVSTCFIKLLQDDGPGAREALESVAQTYSSNDGWRRSMDKFFQCEIFPPCGLLGAVPENPNAEAYSVSVSASLLRRKEGLGAAASMAANLPKSESGSTSLLPPIVASRLIDALLQLCKSPRFCLHTLTCPVLETDASAPDSTCFDQMLELLKKPMFTKSSGNLESLLTLLETAVSPLSHMAKHQDELLELSQRDLDAASASGREYVDVPRVEVSQHRLKLLCYILRIETCREVSFTKVNTIIRRLCRVESNRRHVLAELGSVAHALGVDALRDLKALRIRMDSAVAVHHGKLVQAMDTDVNDDFKKASISIELPGSLSSSVTLSTSTSELKLLRVLQTLQALCNDGIDDHGNKKSESSVIVTEELIHILRQMQFDELWDELSSCLKVVQVLEGVKSFEEVEQKASEDLQNDDDGGDDDGNDEEHRDNAKNKKKLRNSAAGLLTRFLPSIEAFFISNGSATRSASVESSEEAVFGGSPENITLENLVGGQQLMDFVMANKVLLNALIRNAPGLLDKRFRALVQVPRLRIFLDFDVKRQWFKTQVRRLRQQASRRHGSLRLQIRRKYVFEDAYHQLQPRNADEMRGRLHITFRDEAGVDAGGLSREFFGILAKEMFNPNYALFTSTEDGCTFQPNPNSAINPDHLSYFRFVGRVVGKAVADGFLLDAHFTRSLYKHMLGMEPTHHDMEAIDPDYYRNLQTILEYNLGDIGLDLTFSTEDHSFGRNQVIDLIPDGRKIAVTEENKEEYVRKVCQHRMTTSIQNQIKAYLSGFYELVNPELISIFTPRELELLISGLPDIDITDLKQNTDYVGWKATDKEIGWFWNIMFSLSRNEKAAFLQFVTGSSKVPLAGFSELQGMRGVQKFSIHKVGGTKGSLMSAHTCFNSVDLPTYQNEVEMREKLLIAINEGGGAFLFA